MSSTINNHLKHTKDYWAAGLMNIKQVVCICSNWFAEIKKGDDRWAPANESAVCALAPPTTGEPGSF